MTDDEPRELAIDLVWHEGRLAILVIHGDRPLHSDTLDPKSAMARARVIKKLQTKLPAIDIDELDRRLIEAAAKGPPPQVDSTLGTGTLSAVDEDPEPSVESVAGPELLDELTNALTRFVVLPEHGAAILALWILHTFLFDVFEFTPRLLITSPSMRCGKSRLLRLISALVSRPLACEGITGPALFRSIEAYRPTMLIDEADTMLRGKDTNEVLRGVINAGHQRGGRVIRCVGDDSEPKTFEVFAPVAIAMIGKPPGTVEDRSIPITMRRRMPGETVERFEPGRSLREQFMPLVQKCVRWARDHRLSLSGSRPSVPSGVDDRAADCWFSLLAIADVAGGRWPNLAREIAVAVMSGRENGEGIGVELLRDLKALFDKSGIDRMSTSSIITSLVLLEERPWPEYRRGQPITPRQIATLLSAFEVRSKNLRLPEGSVAKGYLCADFEDVWRRYFPERGGDPPAPSATALHTLSDKGLGPFTSATGSNGVADGNSRNSLQNKPCSVVADGAGGCPGIDSNTAPPRLLDRLRNLVEEMAADIDSAPPGTAPFDGEALRAYYRAAVRRHGIDAALADASARFALQVEGTFLPLQKEAS
ncbi:MAG TPA: DUF3631 domain-containing protein [Planctomycetota bacterium]|nr:DUF3631 domain-containing protein [Planctomycetota bacterium]